MPRNIDLVAEARDLEAKLAANESVRRQFVLRLDAEDALLVVRDCLHQNEQPGPLLEEVVGNYYRKWSQGAHLELPSQLRRALDVIAVRRGKTREEVILDLLRDVTFRELEAISSEAEWQEELLRRAETLVGKK